MLHRPSLASDLGVTSTSARRFELVDHHRGRVGVAAADHPREARRPGSGARSAASPTPFRPDPRPTRAQRKRHRADLHDDVRVGARVAEPLWTLRVSGEEHVAVAEREPDRDGAGLAALRPRAVSLQFQWRSRAAKSMALMRAGLLFDEDQETGGVHLAELRGGGDAVVRDIRGPSGASCTMWTCAPRSCGWSGRVGRETRRTPPRIRRVLRSERRRARLRDSASRAVSSSGGAFRIGAAGRERPTGSRCHASRR